MLFTKSRPAAACVALSLATGVSSAAVDTFIFRLVDPSRVTIEPAIAVPFQGTLIGDFDPQANPGGTQTRPGFIGGSGNQPVPLNVTLGTGSDAPSTPAGSLRVDADPDTGVVNVSFLDLDLTASGGLEVPVTLTFLFETFRTFNPNSLYPGGIPLPIPLGQAGIANLRLQQLGESGPGTLTPDGPGVFTFAAAVPVSISLEASFLGQTFPLPAFPAILPLVGRLDTTGPSPVLEASFTGGFSQPLPPDLVAQIPPIENQPLGLPTILPPGQTANVLLNLVATAAELGLTADATLTARGTPHCPADFNNDGFVDCFDHEAFIEAFEAGSPRADFNRDAFIDFFDVQDFASAFDAGC
ncbi:MAG: hypothetical protein HRU70_07075 [Phycisphaeraceae bacterium]|nr:MAG: hypothetical protein HRU70_07075 [Phycisphaeraceae bacterium]